MAKKRDADFYYTGSRKGDEALARAFARVWRKARRTALAPRRRAGKGKP